MSGKVFHRKLVRDLIPEIIRANGDIPHTRTLRGTEYKKALRAKLLEEATECTKAKSRSRLIDELADIQEVMLALYKEFAITCEEVTKTARKKRKQRGGFTKRIFLESTR
jgi:predicted house-cleaning noncanonical NTP pyrophosphatase (MazG superfamily)